MKEKAVREIVQAYFERINGEDYAGLLDLFTPDAELRLGGGQPWRGHAELERYYRSALAPYPEHRDEPVRVVVSGDVATVDIRYEGRLANGRPLSFDAVNVYELADGRIVKLSTWYDSDKVRRMLLQAQTASGPEPEPEGASHRLGSVAEITPARLRAALGLVRRGVAFRLDLPLGQPDPPLFHRQRVRHGVFTPEGEELSMDDRLDSFNTQQGSHWDALSHFARPDGTRYGGWPAAELGIDLWAQGICTRAVLVDLADGLGLTWDGRRDVTPGEVEACAERQDVELRAGDALLLRTGWLAGYLALPPDRRSAEIATPGLAPVEATASWLRERRFAALACDNPGVEAIPGTAEPESLHAAMLPELGLAVGELWWLEDLRADCVADGVWDGLLVSVPLNLPGGCASPANAVVIK